jgi:hypothetical protein
MKRMGCGHGYYLWFGQYISILINEFLSEDTKLRRGIYTRFQTRQ